MQITNLTNKITTIEEKIESSTSSSNCFIGDILYSDMSCDLNVIASKKPIGVVFDRANKLAIGLEESQQYWSTEYFDVPDVDNITDSSLTIKDLDGKKNTSTVLAYCKANGKSCPAFEYVNSYKTEGTDVGDWYLPIMRELHSIYDNKDVLNIALEKIGGTTLGTGWYWSSSEYSISNAWVLTFSSSSVGNYHKGNSFYVRPVLAF